jgi:hypothetical protein
MPDCGASQEKRQNARNQTVDAKSVDEGQLDIHEVHGEENA